MSSDLPPPYVILKFLFYLHLYSWCHKSGKVQSPNLQAIIYKMPLVTWSLSARLNDNYASAFWDLNKQGQDLKPGYLDLNWTTLTLSYLPLLFLKVAYFEIDLKYICFISHISISKQCVGIITNRAFNNFYVLMLFLRLAFWSSQFCIWLESWVPWALTIQ